MIVTFENFDLHVSWLLAIATLLKQTGLTIYVLKRKFCLNAVKYLSYIVGHGSAKTVPTKHLALTGFPLSRTVQQVRQFFGMVN